MTKTTHIHTRIAPSPTGDMHVATLKGALINYAYANQNNGWFSLRIDDTDKERSQDKYIQQIIDDLSWGKIPYDKKIQQSLRLELYLEKLHILQTLGLVYPCYETKEELIAKRKVLLKAGRPPIYDRAALSKTNGVPLRAAHQDDYELHGGSKPHWRFYLEHKNISWNDIIKGKMNIDCSHVSDPIIVDSSGNPLYIFASVVDDVTERITHIFRGEDHVINTATQIQIFEALGNTSIQFGHFPIMKSIEGKKLSKRNGANSVKELRELGVSSMALNSFLLSSGMSNQSLQNVYTMDDLINNFDINKISTSNIMIDTTSILKHNKRWLSHAPFEYIKDDLLNVITTHCPSIQNDISSTNFLTAFWQTIRYNIESLLEAKDWFDRIYHSKYDLTSFSNDQITQLKTFVYYLRNHHQYHSADQHTHTEKELTGNHYHICNCQIISQETLEEALNKSTTNKKEFCQLLRQFITGNKNGPTILDLINLIGIQRLINKVPYVE